MPVVDKLITIQLLKAVARVSYDRSEGSGTRSSDGSMLANIQIAGVIDIPVNVPANTRIDIPDVGHVILFRRIANHPQFESYMRVTMLRLVIDQDIAVLGIPAGTVFDLATAKAAVGRA
jgi:hypothetical protein